MEHTTRYTDQAETIVRASSPVDAGVALMRRMRCAGHEPELVWIGRGVPGALSGGASCSCADCRCGEWFAFEKEAQRGWHIDAIQICTGGR